MVGVVGKTVTHPACRAVGAGESRNHFGAQARGEGCQMSARGSVPGSFGRKMREQLLGVVLPHPEVGVGSRHPVLGVREVARASGGRGGRGVRGVGWAHDAQRSAARLAVAMIAGLAMLLPGLVPQADAADSSESADGDVTFTVALLNEV